MPERIIDLAGYITVALSARVRDPGGRWRALGVLARHALTDAYAAHLVQVMLGATTHGAFHYHDTGTGQTAEATTDTALETPCGEARDTGTRVLGANARQYVTVATHTYAAAFTIMEHGVFSAATAGTLLDRSVFADNPATVVLGGQVEWTYTLTVTAGG